MRITDYCRKVAATILPPLPSLQIPISAPWLPGKQSQTEFSPAVLLQSMRRPKGPMIRCFTRWVRASVIQITYLLPLRWRAVSAMIPLGWSMRMLPH